MDLDDDDDLVDDDDDYDLDVDDDLDDDDDDDSGKYFLRRWNQLGVLVYDTPSDPRQKAGLSVS